MSKVRLERLDQGSLSERVYEKLRASIISGRFAPGERLIETELSEDLGVSRAPVREAFRKLGNDQLVEERPRHGTYVRRFNVKDFVDTYNLISAIEGLAVRLIVRQQTSLEALECIVCEATEAADHGDSHQIMELELEFHRQLCCAAGNYQLNNVFQMLSVMVSMALSFNEATCEEIRQIATKHRLLLDTLRESMRTDNEEQAISVVRSHLQSSLGVATSHLENRPSGDSYPLIIANEPQ